MRHTAFIATLGLLTFAGVVWCATAVWDSSNFTMEERKWQPAPTGHVPGADNAPSMATAPGHHATDDCGICHGSNGRASSRVFTLTGTVYDSRAARKPLPGAEIIFQDYEGKVFSVTANELGMLWTEAEMSGDPSLITTTVTSTTDSNTWRYKTWVKAGDGVRPMMTMPAVGGMAVPRMSCNMHHVVSGTLGGLWAVPNGTLRSYPASGLSYGRHIFPILRTKCGPCHIPGATEASQAGETFDYGAGLDLMTYEGSAVEEGGEVHVKRGVLEVVNTANPDASLLFAKTLDGAVHGGGTFWTSQSADYRALRQWIAEGAKNN